MPPKKDNLPVNVDVDLQNGGTITYANEVIAIIAGVAANEIDGIAGMCTSGGIGDIIGRNRNITRGVRVEIGSEEASVDIYAIVEYGKPIQKVASEVQENVRKAIETMTGLRVVRVDVHVQGVSFEKEKKETKESLAAAHTAVLESPASEEKTAEKPAACETEPEKAEDCCTCETDADKPEACCSCETDADKPEACCTCETDADKPEDCCACDADADKPEACCSCDADADKPEACCSCETDADKADEGCACNADADKAEDCCACDADADKAPRETIYAELLIDDEDVKSDTPETTAIPEAPAAEEAAEPAAQAPAGDTDAPQKGRRPRKR